MPLCGERTTLYLAHGVRLSLTNQAKERRRAASRRRPYAMLVLVCTRGARGQNNNSGAGPGVVSPVTPLPRSSINKFARQVAKGRRMSRHMTHWAR